MDHTLINTLVSSIVAAFVLGMLAKKLNLPAIFGYLMAGVLLGAHTPGFVADIGLAQQLSEIGVILLMFGVGLHFSFSDLMHVRKIAVPGALFQMLTATLIGAAVVYFTSYDIVTGLLFGFSLSVASTVVLLRALEQRNAIDTESGKIAIGWLIVEDIAMVLALVLLPVIADMIKGDRHITASMIFSEGLQVGLKVCGFVLIMMVVGRRFLPWLLVAIAKTRSRELSTLGTLAIALGFAFIAYKGFDASFALGAFMAGMILSESAIGYKAAEQSLPMRDAFAVLFFVSVGMLFDPMTIFDHPGLVLATLGVIIIGKAAAALVITRFFRQSNEISMTIAISLAQIGEFSFILAGMALAEGLLPKHLYNIILAGALLSIAINPFLFKGFDYFNNPHSIWQRAKRPRKSYANEK